MLDIGGLLLGTGSLFAFTYALIEANQLGWTDRASSAASPRARCSALGSSRGAPHDPPDAAALLLPHPGVHGGERRGVLGLLGMFATFFFLSLFMQNPFLRDYSAFETGLRFLPMTLMIVVTAPNAGRYASKHGSRAPMTYG